MDVWGVHREAAHLNNRRMSKRLVGIWKGGILHAGLRAVRDATCRKTHGFT